MTLATGTIVHMQRCPAHREAMEALETVQIITGQGMEGDAHARADSTRQLLLMDEETLAHFELSAGAVRENITTRGIIFGTVREGMQVRAGDVVLEITKACTPCSRMEEIRPGLRAALEGQRGFLARVIRGGTLNVGDAIQVEEQKSGALN